VWNSSVCFLRWRVSATPFNRLVFLLAPSMPDTDECEFGLWPTPTTDSATERQANYAQGGTPLTLAVKMWPTPMSYSHSEESNAPGITKLDCAVRPELNKHLFPTPTAIDSGGGPALNKFGGSGARAKMAQMVSKEELNGQLNPAFVEYLMGYPIGYTDCEDSETQSSRKSPTKS